MPFIRGPLVAQEHALRRQYNVDAIVNCAGLGGAELAAGGLALFALRVSGVLIRLRNDGKSMPRIERAHCVANDASEQDQDMVFIVPQGTDTLLLGGLLEADECGLDIDLDNYPPIQHILQRCTAFLPALSRAVVDPVELVRVGLRPFRTQNARVEREANTSIIHNYGHGGSGVTLSWCCGSEVAERVESLLGVERMSADSGLAVDPL